MFVPHVSRWVGVQCSRSQARWESCRAICAFHFTTGVGVLLGVEVKREGGEQQQRQHKSELPTPQSSGCCTPSTRLPTMASLFAIAGDFARPGLCPGADLGACAAVHVWPSSRAVYLQR